MLKTILSSHYNRMILLIIILTVLYVSLMITHVFGETEQNCIEYQTNHLLIIGTSYIYGHQNVLFDHDGCNWLVDRLLYNGSGFHVSGYAENQGGRYDSPFQYFVLTK